MRRAALGLAALAVAALTAALVRGPSPDPAGAASHREAPLISLDPAADITDFFMFRSYEAGRDDRVVLIMNVSPGEEPSSGPNYFNFDPSVRYSFSVDNDRDGAYDVRFDVDFENEIRGAVDALDLPLAYVAVPPITSLDGPGSEGLGLRQRYTVTMARHGPGGFRRTTLGEDLIAVPSNVGPRTMPDYASLAAQGLHTVAGGDVRVFAGQRQDPFYIDLGGVFDTLNLRRNPPLLGAGEDADDAVNPFGVDMLAGFNVHTIAIEVPAAMLRGTGSVIGAYASTNRSQLSVRGRHSGGARGSLQVQRLANPLVNEVIIGTEDKDDWNATDPRREGKFLKYYLQPRLATALELLYGAGSTGCTPFGSPGCTPTNRNDLVNILLKYGADDPGYADLLRLDLDEAPRALADQKRLTILAGDNAGWPNGRRPRDDVTDVAIRAVGGPFYLENRAGDGVNIDDAPLSSSFPFLALPADGRDYVSGAKQTPHSAPANPLTGS